MATRRDGFPPLVRDAMSLAERIGFRNSCTEEVGRLLRVLAGTCLEHKAGETGTGCGVGAAWVASGLPASQMLVTAERDPALARAASKVLAGAPNVLVLEADWKALQVHAPFGLLFVDGGGKREERDLAIDLIAEGGFIVLDDFTPSTDRPPMFEGRVDELRLWWLTHARHRAVEVTVSPAMAVILATKAR